MTDKLTAKQEAFCRAVAVDGMNQSDAYRSAYDCSKMVHTSIHVNASKLMADAKVAQRISELKAEIQERLMEKELWSREDSVKVLVSVAQRSDESAKDSDKVRSVSELNKMCGFHAPTKVEHSGVLGIADVASQLTEEQRVEFAKALLRRHGYDFED